MIRKQSILAIAAIGFFIAGCDERKQASSQPVPATQPAHVAPSTQPAQVAAATDDGATKPPPKLLTSSLFIRELDRADDPGFYYPFPRARLHINHEDHTAVLYSDDPKAAIKPDYGGNSYYLIIPLDKNEPLKLDNYQWNFKAASSNEHDESSDGIFLDGQRYHLQPSDVQITFRDKGPLVDIAIYGEFMKHDTAISAVNSQIPVRVGVKGIVTATVDEEK